MGGKGQKLYVYVDESGQDTEGELFVVGIVVTGAQREQLRHELEAIEAASRKGKVKWHLAKRDARIGYIQGIIQLPSLRKRVFVYTVRNSKQYELETARATANAILSVGVSNSRVAMYVDGLPKSHAHRFASVVRASGVRVDKTRGVRRDENEPLIRLADALCGLQRDALQGQRWARALLRSLQHALGLT